MACIALLATTAAQAAGLTDAAAPNADMRYVEASMQRDATHDQTVMGLLSLPVGERWWAQVGGGQTRHEQDAVVRRPGVVNGGIGYFGDAWQISLTASHRRDGSRLRQTDWAGLLEWRGDQSGAGIDVNYRDARLAGTATPSAGTAEVPVLQRVKGGGIGVHGNVQITAKFSVHAAAMQYHYQVTMQQDGTAAGGGQSLLPPSLLVSPSFVSREDSALSRSAMFGANYRFERVTLSGEVLADRVLDPPGSVRTMQLRAAVKVAPQWTVTPAIGRTQSDTYGGVNFGGLALSHAW